MGNKGTALLTTSDSVVGPSGASIRVTNVHLHADGVGAASIELRNGTADTDDEYYFQNTSAGSVSSNVHLGEGGILFTDGCFYDVGANTEYTTITYEVVRNTQ